MRGLGATRQEREDLLRRAGSRFTPGAAISARWLLYRLSSSAEPDESAPPSTREQHCDPAVAACCSAEAAGSRASAACRLGAALWLNAGRTESRTSVGAGFRIAGRMQRCHARVDADAASPKQKRPLGMLRTQSCPVDPFVSCETEGRAPSLWSRGKIQQEARDWGSVRLEDQRGSRPRERGAPCTW